MNIQYLPQLVALVIFAVSSARTLHSEEDFGDLDLLKDNDLISINNEDVHSTCPDFPKPVDCAEVYKNGYRDNGLYTIYPNHRIIPCGKLLVYCDMNKDGGGWTVIQRRGDFKRPQDYFNKNWNEYKNGFGSIKEDFWLGNDKIYVLSNQKKYSVRFDLETAKGEQAYALYDEFWIENEDLKYKLHIDNYSGTAGDSMSYHNIMSFSTKDRQNDKTENTPCALRFKGGWWYNKCFEANLNGLYWKDSHVGKTANRTVWHSWKGSYESLAKVEIKLRPVDFKYRNHV